MSLNDLTDGELEVLIFAPPILWLLFLLVALAFAVQP